MKNRHLLRIIPVLAVLLALLCCGAAMADGGTGIPIDEAHFPDTDFRKYVANNFDTDGDLWLNEDEIAKAENITMEEDHDVYSLEGVEYFTELSYILIDSNPHLTSIDLRANTKLSGIELFDNGLTEIHLDGLTKLTDIAVDGNALAELDLSTLVLENLYCYNNPLRSLVLGDQPELKILRCYGTGDGMGAILNELDLSGCPVLIDAVQNGIRSEPDWGVLYSDGPLGGKLFVDAGTKLIYPGAVEPTFFLPAALTTIESEAFSGIDANGVVIPAGVTFIASDAFAGSSVTTIYGYAGSAAEAFCADHTEFTFVRIDD